MRFKHLTTKERKELLRWATTNYFLILFIILLVLNSLLADWNLDPIHDIFLTRTYGPLFPNIHPLSIGFPVTLALFLAWREKNLAKGIFLGLSTVPLHDFVWSGIELMNTGRQWELGWFYILGEIIVFVGALYFVTKKQVWIMFTILCAMIGIYGLGWALGTIGTLTVVDGTMPMLYDLKNNALEVMAWITGPIIWFCIDR